MRKFLLLVCFVFNFHNLLSQTLTFDFEYADRLLTSLEADDLSSVDLEGLENSAAFAANQIKNGAIAKIGFEEWLTGLRTDVIKRDALLDNRQFIKLIKSDSLRLKKEILKDFLPFNKVSTANYSVVFLIGGSSAGFTLIEYPNHIFIDLSLFKKDLASLELTVKHELFHHMQSAYFDVSGNSELLKKENLGLAIVHAIIYYLFQEGTAEYFADLRTKDSDQNPHVKELLGNQKPNVYRGASTYYLLERMLLDGYRNSDEIDFSNMYTILFDWNWNNPGYFIGNEMARVLINSPKDMELYLSQDPVYFFRDYMILDSSDKKYTFSPQLRAVIEEMVLVLR